MAIVVKTEGMEIVVKIGTDKSITLVVKAWDTIASVQAKIQDSEGIPAEKQRLIFGEHAQLLPHKTVFKYRITQGSVLHLIISDEQPVEMFRLVLRLAHKACKRQRLWRSCSVLKQRTARTTSEWAQPNLAHRCPTAGIHSGGGADFVLYRGCTVHTVHCSNGAI